METDKKVTDIRDAVKKETQTAEEKAKEAADFERRAVINKISAIDNQLHRLRGWVKSDRSVLRYSAWYGALGVLLKLLSGGNIVVVAAVGVVLFLIMYAILTFVDAVVYNGTLFSGLLL